MDIETLAKLTNEAPYLNLPCWAIRAAAYVALWIALDEQLARWTARAGRDPGALVRARSLSPARLPAVGLTLTFAAFDWLMSLSSRSSAGS